ncbi:MAG TPA: ATP-dependent DNA helicase RecQ [Solirubrobacteraceae bacterium]|jgi:ATP-dependent DNA helicase RecQ|nr:ATP-dependent DNA helicase RecQ [Solirubrobacteraceae bacterium]
MRHGVTPEQLLGRFGLDEFRPGQREAVQAALDGRDSLVVMPTGGGKSLCYQLPALAGHGLVVVVSPLIALMADQWRRLQQAGVSATMLASGMEDGHNAQALREIESGETKLVLAAPERFASPAFRSALARREVSLFVVDEAHCVAEWGHDFRPDYLRLHDAIASLSSSHAGAERPPVMAATATATPRVAEEIAARLELHQPVSIRSGFDRPNVTFDVVSVEGKGAVARKWAALLHVLRDEQARPAIVYCGTRKDTDTVTERLAAEGIAGVAYHAGMSPESRRASQEAFMDGRAEVVVATNAFGMGVDKANVRTVAHWALPTSLEAYYQEAGRGGRDGEPARALLLGARMDLGRLIRFIKERETSVEHVKSYVGRLRRGAERGPQGETAIVGHGELGERDRVLLSIAERAGAVELEPAGADGLYVHLTGRGSPRRAAAAIQAARNRGWDSYRSIERYMTSGETCRRRQILDHFGDHEPVSPSGRCCDVCRPDEALAAAVSAPIKAGRGGGRSASGRARAAAGAPEREQLSSDQEQQFERLRAWRYERAEGKPAYTVASNAVLEDLLLAAPTSLPALLEIRGIGPAFCEKHGESLLAALAALAALEPAPARG